MWATYIRACAEAVDQPAASLQPCECALHDPAAGTTSKPLALSVRLLQGERADLLHRALKPEEPVASILSALTRAWVRPAWLEAELTLSAVTVLQRSMSADPSQHEEEPKDSATGCEDMARGNGGADHPQRRLDESRGSCRQHPAR